MPKCKFCGKEYTERGLKIHEGVCKENPDRDLERVRILKENGANTYRKLNTRLKEKNEATRKSRKFTCQGCGKEFYLNLTDNEYNRKNYKNKKYCSIKCSGKYAFKNSIKNNSNQYTFSNEILQKISNASKRHWEEYRKTHPKKEKQYKELTCKICGKKYTVKEHNSLYYCSDECRNIAYNKHNSGHKRNISEETRLKLSLAGQNSAKKQAEERRSKNEKYFCSLCEKYFENVEHNIPMFNKWDADVIIHDIKVAVLWKGPWHYRKITDKHSVLQVQNRDKIKIKEIEKAGYIPYIVKDDGKYNQRFVEEEFQKFLKCFALK